MLRLCCFLYCNTPGIIMCMRRLQSSYLLNELLGEFVFLGFCSHQTLMFVPTQSRHNSDSELSDHPTHNPGGWTESAVTSVLVLL